MDLYLSSLDWFIVALSIVGSISLGTWLALRMKAGANSANFFLAGRRMTWPIIGASFFATNIGAEHLVGLSGDANRYGLSASTIEFTGILSMGFAAAFMYPYYVKHRVFTIPQFVELRFTPSARYVYAGFMLLITIMSKMALQLYAGSIVLSGLLGWDLMTTVVVLGAFTAVVTMVGGFATVAYTDTVQTTIIIIGCAIMTMIGLHQVGGWESLAQAVPDAIHIAKPYNDPNYPFWGIVLAGFYAGVFYWGIDQTNVQRVLGARDVHHARWGTMFAILLKLAPVFIFALPGVIALALFPHSESKLTFVTMLNELLPNGLRGVVVAALMAAIISSLDAAMNSISTLVVADFVVPWWPQTSERMRVLLGRIAILVGTALGMGAAYLVHRTEGGVFKYFQTLGAYLFLPFTPALIFGILSKRVTAAGAGVSVLVGTCISAVLMADELMGAKLGAVAFPWLHKTWTLNYSYRGAWGFLLITAVLVAVSACTAKTAPEKLEQTTVDWGGAAEPFAGLSDWRLQLGLLSVLTVALYAWLW